MTSPNQETDPAHEDASKEFAPHRSGRWVETALQYRYAIVILLVFAWVFGQKAWAAEFTKASDCVVGQRVVNRDKQAGVIVKADGSSCHVKLDATGKIDYNIFWMLRPEASPGKSTAGSPSQRDPSGGQSKSGSTNPANPASTGLAPGKYACYMLTGGTLNYAFIDIHIDSANRYRDKNSKSGTYSVDGNQKIIFTGPLAAVNAKLLPGQRIGLNMNGGNFFNTSCSMKS